MSVIGGNRTYSNNSWESKALAVWVIGLETYKSIMGGEWSFKKSEARKILAEFQGSRSLVFQQIWGLGVSIFFAMQSLSLSQATRR